MTVLVDLDITRKVHATIWQSESKCYTFYTVEISKTLLFQTRKFYLPRDYILTLPDATMHFRSLALTVAVSIAVSFCFPDRIAMSATLLMFEEEYCSWCDKWNEEIGVVYGLTPESCKAQLKRVDVTDGVPTDVLVNEKIIYTPTFVLVYEGSEIGRITGYPGEDFFWVWLNDLIDAIPTQSSENQVEQC